MAAISKVAGSGVATGLLVGGGFVEGNGSGRGSIGGGLSTGGGFTGPGSGVICNSGVSPRTHQPPSGTESEPVPRVFPVESVIVAVSKNAKRIAIAEGAEATVDVAELGREYVRFECYGRGESVAWTQPFWLREV